jgi:RNA polymerase sigma-70 factor (ECF subfamily)
VALHETDRNLLQQCLSREPRAWESFVDRFLGLVQHVVRHTVKSRSLQISAEDEEDLIAEFFVTVVRDDFALLRRFRLQSSLHTYLAVVARRVVVRELLRRFSAARMGDAAAAHVAVASIADEGLETPEQRISNREQVERLMGGLTGPEAAVVRLYHLEGKSYREISSAIGVPENSIGPTLSRARDKMRRSTVDSPA